MITSSNNKQLKNIRLLLKSAKARREQGLFVIEGMRLVKEAPEDLIAAVYVAERAAGLLLEPVGTLSTLKAETVRDDIFNSISDTASPQGILAVVKIPECNIDGVLGGPSFRDVSGGSADKHSPRARRLYVLLDNIQDPGNLGTILRTAEAAGADGVFMSEGCADIFNPKVVRSTMGSIFRVKHCVCDLAAAIRRLRDTGCEVYAAALEGALEYDEVSYGAAAAFIIGNEGNGIREELLKEVNGIVKIPMAGSVESLNAAVSAAVLLFNPQLRK